MQTLDWIVLSGYLVAVLAVSVLVGRRQRTPDDYFLAGRSMGAWPIALSIMATQVSAVSLIGAPAFVALKAGGGLRWLQYELAVPLAMIVLIAIFVPNLRPLPITTLYDYLQRRYGDRSRAALSVVFLVSRGLSTAVALYAASIVIAVCLGTSLEWALVILALFTVAYTTIGGIEADIYSDILQMFVLAGGTIVALVIVMVKIGDVGASALAKVDPSRFHTLDLSGAGFSAGQTYSLLPMVVGGFFLYLAYYGCDQSQAQRLFASVTEREGQRALYLNGLLRFPFALVYCLLGAALAVFLVAHPDFGARVPVDHPDYLVPMFVLEFFPPGLVGLVIAAIFAASMSSFDSAFNSMSAVTVRNLLGATSPDAATLTLARSRVWTAVWGLVCTALGYGMSRSGATVIELVNMIGSAFYGPTLALFGVGLFSRRAGERGALTGLAAGVATNAALWLFAPEVSWLWWNPIGFAVAAVLGTLVWRAAPDPSRAQRPPVVAFTRQWTLGLLCGFLLMIITCLLLERTLLSAGR